MTAIDATSHSTEAAETAHARPAGQPRTAEQPNPTPPRRRWWRTLLFRTGVVLTVIMGLANTINGGSALLGIQENDATAIAVLLVAIGVPTLLLSGLAWLPRQWALWTLIVLRALEALTMWVPFGPGDWYHEPDKHGFYLTLVATSLLVSALMAVGLSRRTGLSRRAGLGRRTGRGR